MSIKITNHRPYRKGALSAFFTVTFPSGLVIHEVKLFEKEGRRWIGLPSRRFTDKEGSTGYAPIMEFTNREACESFRDAVLRAIDTNAASDQHQNGRQNQRKTSTSGPSGQHEAKPLDDSDIPF